MLKAGNRQEAKSKKPKDENQIFQRISSFPPVISKRSKILILGSIPGAKSLEMRQYYAHPQNRFWKIIFELLNENFTTDYSEKIKILKKHHIALWDVIDSCERKGSLDL
jgi:hypoxanthine-DNA glycosylase